MKHKFTDIEDEYIIKNYNTKTYKEIDKSLGLTEYQIKHRIQRHLKITLSKRKKHFYKYDVFKTENPNKYYILGLIASDGNLYNDGYKNRYKVSISSNKSDRCILEKINSMICDTKIVFDRKNQNLSELVLYDKVIYDEIKKYNINENKSLSLDYPNNIPLQYQKDFIRGYFDGDGSLSISKKGNYEKLTIQFLGTKKFLSGIMNVINENLFISCKNILNTNSKIKSLRYFTKEARTIMNWLYSDENALKLNRKYDKYKQYIDKFND